MQKLKYPSYNLFYSRLMTPTQHLHSLYMAHHRERYPNVPAVCIPKPDYTDKTTNGLTKMIMDYVKFRGGMAKRVNVVGRQIKAKSGKQIWIPSSTVKGAADLSIIYNGRALEVEVKCAATHDRMRPKQVEYANRVAMAGGLYFVARTFDEFYEWFQTI